MTKVVLLLVLSQYNRSRVNEADSSSQCLWWKESSTIVYRQNTRGDPLTSRDGEFDAVARAFGTWQAQMDVCGSLTLREGARTGTLTVGFEEGSDQNENAFVFRQRRCTGMVQPTDGCWAQDDCGNVYDCWQHSASAIAITTTSYNPTSGRILDSDVEYNSPAYVFTTVDAPPCVAPNFNESCVATDVQNTATHEIGHMLGLAHITTPGSTMHPRADPGETSKRVLDTGTKQFVCDVYPKGQATRTCKTVSFDGSLGKYAGGCAAGPGGVVGGLLALLALRRRRAG